MCIRDSDLNPASHTQRRAVDAHIEIEPKHVRNRVKGHHRENPNEIGREAAARDKSILDELRAFNKATQREDTSR
eukprot:9468433-Pyramimonas_sp.AAC.1